MKEHRSLSSKRTTVTTTTTKAIRTLFIGCALLAVGFMGIVSSPQIIFISVNAQSEEGSEHACPVPGYTLTKGRCTAEPIPELECIPSSVGGVTVQLKDNKCVAGAPAENEAFVDDCNDIEGSTLVITEGRGGPVATCTFDPTQTGITCPGGVTPTDQGECITNPGQGNNPPTA
jgi:hypothetical protein